MGVWNIHGPVSSGDCSSYSFQVALSSPGGASSYICADQHFTEDVEGSSWRSLEPTPTSHPGQHSNAWFSILRTLAAVMFLDSSSASSTQEDHWDPSACLLPVIQPRNSHLAVTRNNLRAHFVFSLSENTIYTTWCSVSENHCSLTFSLFFSLFKIEA